MRHRRSEARARRERQAAARQRECMNTFVGALERAGKTEQEISRLSRLYLLRLNRARREQCGRR